MGIDKIQIKNFTVFKDIEINFSKGINVFIGENGTGKTHLLKLLYILNKYNMSADNYLVRPVVLKLLEEYFAVNRVLELFTYPQNTMDINFLYNNTNYNFEFHQIEGGGVSVRCNPKCESILSVFIPAKETLSMSNILRVHKKYSKELKLDKSLFDIIELAQYICPNDIPEIALSILPKLEKLIDGKIFVDKDNSFWVEKTNGRKIPFSVEAEGLRKLGLLWQLLRNESITKDTVLIWDEPEANLNPKLIPDLVEILLELSRNGVQIFLATHDYFFTSFMDVLKKENDDVLFHSLYKTPDGIKCETEKSFDLLDNNSINEEVIRLYKDGVEKVMGHD